MVFCDLMSFSSKMINYLTTDNFFNILMKMVEKSFSLFIKSIGFEAYDKNLLILGRIFHSVQFFFILFSVDSKTFERNLNFPEKMSFFKRFLIHLFHQNLLFNYFLQDLSHIIPPQTFLSPLIIIETLFFCCFSMLDNSILISHSSQKQLGRFWTRKMKTRVAEIERAEKVVIETFLTPQSATVMNFKNRKGTNSDGK